MSRRRVCVCVVEIFRPCVLTFEVGFGSLHFIIAIKMSIRKLNLEMNRVLEIPLGLKHRQNQNITCFFTTDALEIKCLLSKTIIKLTFLTNTMF